MSEPRDSDACDARAVHDDAPPLEELCARAARASEAIRDDGVRAAAHAMLIAPSWAAPAPSSTGGSRRPAGASARLARVLAGVAVGVLASTTIALAAVGASAIAERAGAVGEHAARALPGDASAARGAITRPVDATGDDAIGAEDGAAAQTPATTERTGAAERTRVASARRRTATASSDRTPGVAVPDEVRRVASSASGATSATSRDATRDPEIDALVEAALRGRDAAGSARASALPDVPSAIEITTTLRALERDVARCVEAGAAGALPVRVTIDGATGRVIAVAVSSGDPVARACIERVITTQASFSPFRRDHFVVGFAFPTG